jgi:hypothetical protein
MIMKNNKSPESDGLISEFLKKIWKDLKFFVIGSLNYGYSLGSLSVTQKQGIQKLSQNLLTKINQVYHSPLHILLYQTKA